MRFSTFTTAVVLSLCLLTTGGAHAAPEPIRLGWVGGMTGPTAKYGAYQSALLAEEDINKEGGILGRPVVITYEDGKGNGRTAVQALLKLTSADKISFIIGGHSTPESLPMATAAARQGALMLAAITSSPKLSNINSSFLRVTAVSLQGAYALVDYTIESKGLTSCGVLYELTDYAQPLAEGFRDRFIERGGSVPMFEGVGVGESDLRPLLVRMKAAKLPCLYLGVQSPETAVLVLQQAKEISFSPLVLGNEITGNAATTAGSRAALFEGLVFGEPEFNPESPRTKAFIERFKRKFSVEALPYGFWSAEAYDAVRLMADAVGRCGDAVSEVRRCLLETNGYEGVSGTITINDKGDGVRRYLVKTIRGGVPSE